MFARLIEMTELELLAPGLPGGGLVLLTVTGPDCLQTGTPATSAR